MHTQKASPFKTPVFNSGMSHACTASASLVHSHQHVDLASSPVQVPVSVIDRLLESSRSLPLGPEMTPVQVWAILVNIASQQAITFSIYALLKDELSKYMRCNSFGTTIEIDTLRQVLNWFFPWYSTAQLHDNKIGITLWGQQQMDDLGGLGWEEFF